MPVKCLNTISSHVPGNIVVYQIGNLCKVLKIKVHIINHQYFFVQFRWFVGNTEAAV